MPALCCRRRTRSGTADRGQAWPIGRSEMPQHYQTASRMLGVRENNILGAADHLLKSTGEAAGVAETFYRTRVGIFQAPEGEVGQSRLFPIPSSEGKVRRVPHASAVAAA